MSSTQNKTHHKSIDVYIKDINEKYNTGLGREHAYRSSLETLIKKFNNSLIVISEPPLNKKIGRKPDIIIKKQNAIVGYIETKDIDDTDLEGNNIHNHKVQFDALKEGLNKIIFTDYLNFLFYRDNNKIKEVRIAHVGKNNKVVAEKEKYDEFYMLIQDFMADNSESIKDPNLLAEQMAFKAKLLKENIDSLNNQDEQLQTQFDYFRDKLIKDITKDRFADLYAQTIVYGLFAARINNQQQSKCDQFDITNIIDFLPKSNPFLLNLFKNLFERKEEKKLNIDWLIDDLINLYANADLLSILNKYNSSQKERDPIVYFYEKFLEEYDKEQKTNLGVWFTPKPIVNFIIKAIDYILKQDFKISKGLLDNSKININRNEDKKDKIHKIQILDPATGTGTFLAELLRYMYSEIEKNGQKGIWADEVKQNIIPRLNGFEILMASYAIAHLKLELVLKEIDKEYNIDNERFNIYLTDSLSEPNEEIQKLPFNDWLSNEGIEANRIKEKPIMIVLGNPPYNGQSKNKGRWITDLIQDYYKEPNKDQNIDFSNSKSNIGNDYVKFIRLGEYFIKGENIINDNNFEENKCGILAYINPQSFLDGPTFRGMRFHLLKTFDKIYIVNLHGNNKNKDKNVFDIKQEVCINIFVRDGSNQQPTTNNQQPTTNNQQPTTNNQQPTTNNQQPTTNNQPNGLAKVFYYDLYGKRETKFEFLNSKTINSIDWKKIEYQTDTELFTPLYLFTPQEFSINPKDEDAKQIKRDFYAGFAIDELFDEKANGFVTSRDDFTIYFSEGQLKDTIEKFLAIKDDKKAREHFNIGKDSDNWKISKAREDLEQFYPDKGKFVEINYRPFDIRSSFYTGRTNGWYSRPSPNDIMKHILTGKVENLGLCICQYITTGNTYQHVFITNKIIEKGFISNGKSEGAFLFPLYLYTEDGLRSPNIKDKEIIKEIENKTGLQFKPEKEENDNTFAPIDLMDYIYAVLHCPNYREKYIVFLKNGFPKIPYPKNQGEFKNLINIGSKLRKLHLFKDDVLNEININITFHEYGSRKIENVTYKNKNDVYINEKQYFGNISEEVWNFKIGSYQPAKQWLNLNNYNKPNNRKGKILSLDDIEYYQKMIKVIYETINIMNNELKNIKF